MAQLDHAPQQQAVSRVNAVKISNGDH